MFENADIIREGIWLYDGYTKCKVRIIIWHTLYGTGDYEDTPDIANDKEIECYYVLLESTHEKGEFSTYRGGFLSIQEAIDDAENCTFQKIIWSK